MFEEALPLIGWGALVVAVWMFVLWIWHLRLENAALADFGWAAGVAFLGGFYAVKGDGYGPRRLLLATMVLVWGLRLAYHLLSDRILGEKPEDPRYAALREKWQSYPGLRFFLFFQFRALLAVILSVPFFLLAADPYPEITGFEWAGLLLWAIAILGESASDSQLKRFKADPENQGRVCQEGLWSWSRHPNYFFEWLIWIAYFVAALATPYGAWAIVCPVLMLYFLFCVGIPATEEHTLQSRGEEYQEYQRTTSTFVPWFKKS
jgi:steroid 5-alpha reductase family enzyme